MKSQQNFTLGHKSSARNNRAMSFFSSNKEEKKANGIGGKLRGRLDSSPGPLKPRLEQASHQIRSVLGRLDSTVLKLREKESSLFNGIVSAIQKRDAPRANMYANELAEVRKISKIVMQSKLALEQIMLRLNTISDLGEVVMTLAPATSMVGSIRQSLGAIGPEADAEMSEISAMLSGILADAGSVKGSTLDFRVANEEAETLLSEAASVAESRIGAELPEIPAEEPLDVEPEMEEA